MSNIDCEILSFNEIIEAHWEELHLKIFQRVDTNEIMGTVYAKYDNSFKLSSMLNDGIIEFLNKDKTNVKIIFGVDFDKDHKLFKVII